MQQFSRLQYRRNRLTQRRAYLLLFVSVILIAALLKFGLPALFNLTGVISTINRKPTASTDLALAPSVPKLSQDFEATNSSHVKISGVADPKMTINLFQNGQSGETTISDDNGKFSFEVDLVKGTNGFSAQAISDSGKKSDKSEVYTINYLTAQPTLTINSPKDGDSVKDSPVQIQGKTDVGNTVTVNGRTAVVDSTGSFGIYLPLNNGDNKVKIVSTDQAGNGKTMEITIKFSP